MGDERRYGLFVPVMNRTLQRAGRERILREMRKMGAETVFLALQPCSPQRKEREEELAVLRENCRFFQEAGLTVGAWTWSFMIRGTHSFTCIRTVSGKTVEEEACPLDGSFRALAAEWIREIAGTGVQMILFDDDFRFGFHRLGLGCACRLHLDAVSARLGKALLQEDLPARLLSGGANSCRSAWLAVNKEALEHFAAEMRQALDTVNPEIRLGLCSCLSSWDMDGTDPLTVARLLAGKTKPFLRMIGAPYWAVRRSFGCCLNDVFEYERMQSEWWHGQGAELVCEGDTYPRPRWNCPASYLELFDLAMRADGKSDGILKYVFDYRMNCGSEPGYVRMYLSNRALALDVERTFAPKQALGVRVWEQRKKFEQMEIPAPVAGKDEVQKLTFSPAAGLLSALSVPTVYAGMGCAGIAFGENVRGVPADALQGGLITDARGAELMTEAGVDVGIRGWGRTASASLEFFAAEDDVSSACGQKIREAFLAPEALLESWFLEPEEERVSFLSGAELRRWKAAPNGKLPASYRYRNRNGGRFLVLLSDAYFSDPEKNRSYSRQRQIQSAVPWLCGQELAAKISGSPDVYVMTKRGAGRLAVGIWNLSPDPVPEPVLSLAQPGREIRFLGCGGSLSGRTVKLTGLAPFSFAGFEVCEGK